MTVPSGRAPWTESLIEIHQSAIREHAGELFNYFVRWIMRIDFSDTQCGFKAFRMDRARIIFQATAHGGIRLRPRNPVSGKTPSFAGGGGARAMVARRGYKSEPRQGWSKDVIGAAGGPRVRPEGVLSTNNFIAGRGRI